MAMFAGGATAASAEPVCLTDAAVEATDVLDALADRSLLRRHVDATGETRYTMLRPVQAFASEMLDSSGERDDTADRHAAFFRALALEAESHVMRGEELWLDRLETDHDNLRSAMDRLVQRGMIPDALRMGIALWRYWDARSYVREGVDQLRLALSSATDDVPISLRLSALYAAGVLAEACGDLELAQEDRPELLLATRVRVAGRLGRAAALLRAAGQEHQDGEPAHASSKSTGWSTSRRTPGSATSRSRRRHCRSCRTSRAGRSPASSADQTARPIATGWPPRPSWRGTTTSASTARIAATVAGATAG
jgi:hypothetical protein